MLKMNNFTYSFLITKYFFHGECNLDEIKVSCDCEACDCEHKSSTVCNSFDAKNE